MSFTGDLDLTVHHFGLRGHLDGFASPHAFNIEGDSTLNLTPLRLSGNALISSKGMGACGRAQLRAFGFGVGVGPRIGFSYGWGGNLNVVTSSCDVGRLEVPPPNFVRDSLVTPTFHETSPAQFAVFAATGGDFKVSGPTGTFATDPTDTPNPGHRELLRRSRTRTTSSTTPPTSASRSRPAHAAKHSQRPLHVDANARCDAQRRRRSTRAQGTRPSHRADRNHCLCHTERRKGTADLHDPSANELTTGETVSFYQGISSGLAGAEPIVQDVTTSGVGSFTPEPIGPTSRFVFAIVSIDGTPREQFRVAGFTASSLPQTTVTARYLARRRAGRSPSSVRPPVAIWELLATTDDGRTTYDEVPGADKTVLNALGANSEQAST